MEGLRKVGQTLFYPFHQGPKASKTAFERMNLPFRQIQAEQHIVPEKIIRRRLAFGQETAGFAKNGIEITPLCGRSECPECLLYQGGPFILEILSIVHFPFLLSGNAGYVCDFLAYHYKGKSCIKYNRKYLL
jgi:hypothetical protein